MSHLLGRLLNSNGVFFDRLIDDLEKAINNQCIDVDLVGKTLTSVNHKLRQLRLEPGNTLPEELYQALLARFVIDNQVVSHQLFSSQMSQQQKTDKLIEFINQLIEIEVLSLSEHFLINLFISNPPKQLLKMLDLKHPDQLLKEYSFEQIIIFCFELESKAWQDRTKEYLLTKLKRGYLEYKPIKIELADDDLLDLATEKLIRQNQLTNSILIDSKLIDFDNILLTLVNILTEIERKVDQQNSFNLLRVVGSFEDSFKRWYQPKEQFVWSVAGNPVPWRSINRTFASQDSLLNRALSSISDQKMIDFDPYQTLLAKLPQLAFWQDTADLAYSYQSTVISFNLFDVSRNYQRPALSLSQNDYFEAKLWQSLIGQYLANQVLADRVVNQLKTKLLAKKA